MKDPRNPRRHLRDGRLFVVLHPGGDPDGVVAACGGKKERFITSANALVVVVPEDHATAVGVLRTYAEHPAVRAVDFESVYPQAHESVPSDPNWPDQVHSLDPCGLTQAWDVTLGNPSVLIGHLDSGINPVVNELPMYDRVGAYGYQGTNGCHGHETYSIMRSLQNATGIAGIAPGCSYAGSVDDLSMSTTLELLQWCADQGCRCVSCSWGYYIVVGSADEIAFLNTIDYMWQRNCFIVASAGNGGQSNDVTAWVNGVDSGSYHRPTGYPHVVGVGSLCQGTTNTLPDGSVNNMDPSTHLYRNPQPGDPSGWTSGSGSNWGSSVTIWTYANDVMVSKYVVELPWHPAATWTPIYGTSFAAPQIAATLGLIASVDPTLTAQQLIDIVHNTATLLSPTILSPNGNKRYNAGAAVLAARGGFAYSGVTPLGNNQVKLAGTRRAGTTVALSTSQTVTYPTNQMTNTYWEAVVSGAPGDVIPVTITSSDGGSVATSVQIPWVTVAATSGVVGPVTYPDDYTWQCQIDGITGTSDITVTSYDGQVAQLSVDTVTGATAPTASIEVTGQAPTVNAVASVSVSAPSASSAVAADAPAASTNDGAPAPWLWDGTQLVVLRRWTWDGTKLV